MARGKKWRELNNKKPEIARMYVEEEMSLRDIADEFDTYPNPIMDRLEEMGIDRRSKSESISMANRTEIEITDRQMSIIRGEILGDGYLYQHETKGGNSIKFGLNTTRKEHAEKLVEELPEPLIPDYYPIKKEPSGYSDSPTWLLESRVQTRFESVRSRWYQESSNKDVPDSIELDWTMIYHWYIGDGCLNDRGKNGVRVIFATDGFSSSGVRTLQQKLSELGFNTYTQTSNHVKNGSGEQICLTGSDALNLIGEMKQMNEISQYDYKFEVER
jgi:hypothetical protein